MCICINCNHITKCNTYHLIEYQHKQPHLTNSPLFIPKCPVVHVNISNSGTYNQIDWDLVECLSFVEKPNSWNLDAS